MGRNIICGAGIAEIIAVLSRTRATIKITAAFKTAILKEQDWLVEGSPQTKCTPSAMTPVGQEIDLTFEKEDWRPEDVGKYVRLNKGLCLITKLTNARTVRAEIKQY